MTPQEHNEMAEKVVKNLEEVYDPEMPSISVIHLGLIYDIDTDHLPKVTITHTLTSAFCPAADDIISDIEAAAGMVDGVDGVDVVTTFEPPFGPEMMSEEAKLMLGIDW